MINQLIVTNVNDVFLRGWLPCYSQNKLENDIPYFTVIKSYDNETIYTNIGQSNTQKLKIDFKRLKPRLHVEYIHNAVPFKNLSFILHIDNQTLDYKDHGDSYHSLNVKALNYKAGEYKILFPRLNKISYKSSYLNEDSGGTRFAETWFPLLTIDGVFENRYLHFGSISYGCITVLPNKSHSWSKLFFDLMLSNTENYILGDLKVVN